MKKLNLYQFFYLKIATVILILLSTVVISYPSQKKNNRSKLSSKTNLPCKRINRANNFSKKELKSFRNKTFFCKAKIVKISKNPVLYPKAIFRYQKSLRRLKRSYIIELIPFNNSKRYFLLSTSKEIAEILRPNLNIEFSAQLILSPYKFRGKWIFIWLNQESIYSIE